MKNQKTYNGEQSCFLGFVNRQSFGSLLSVRRTRTGVLVLTKNQCSFVTFNCGDKNCKFEPKKNLKQKKAMTCPRCKAEMLPGIALDREVDGMPEWGTIVTLSKTGPAFITPCLKCVCCGHSVAQ